jgi:hypothetical protein
VFFDQTKATVIAHSKSSVTGKEIITFELEFPRPILAEFNTHNALSKNASSSRAIPVPTMLKQVRENPAFLARYGAANTGMQDKGPHNGLIDIEGIDDWLTAEEAWVNAAKDAAYHAEAFHNAGYAKQVCNRLIEPFQMMKVVMTATELNNFKWLRRHDAADPTIDVLCQKVITAQEASTPVILQPGWWHVPYYNEGYWIPASTARTTDGPVVVDKFGHSLEHALIISSSCSAQVSYRKLDDTIEKARGVVARLNLQGEEPDQPVHASPLEHQCTPFEYPDYESMLIGRFERDLVDWEEGVTHVDRDGQLGSGNMKGWKQHRQLVPNHVKKG